MVPSPKQENAIRRLFRENESRRRRPDSGATAQTDNIDENVATTMSRLARASAELSRLRTTTAAQHSLIYDQKEELASVRRSMAEALAQAVHSEDLCHTEKERADRASARVAQLETELATLRSHVGRLTEAVTASFDPDDHVVALRAVA